MAEQASRPKVRLQQKGDLVTGERVRPWTADLDRYLRHEAWRVREDDRSRARLGGYKWLPPAYEKAVRIVEANPRYVVDRDARPTVAKDVPAEIARAIQAAIDDAHWREFLRLVRNVGQEIEERAKRPIAEIPPEPLVPTASASVVGIVRRKRRGRNKGAKTLSRR